MRQSDVLRSYLLQPSREFVEHNCTPVPQSTIYYLYGVNNTHTNSPVRDRHPPDILTLRIAALQATGRFENPPVPFTALGDPST
jgi:hypothetical protein